MRGLAIGVIASAILLSAGPIWAAQKDHEDCLRGNDDQKVVACTNIINDDSETATVRAAAYVSRAIVWFTKGDHDRAFSDLNEGIRIEPSKPVLATFYNMRGMWNRHVNIDAALADFTEAIQLNPKYYAAYEWRGLIWTVKGEFDRAISEFDEALRGLPNNARCLYDRGIVKQKKGDVTGGNADIAAAIAIQADIAEAYRSAIKLLQNPSW